MLANPRHSQVVLIKPARSGLGEKIAGDPARRFEGLSLLQAGCELFGVELFLAGEARPGRLPERMADPASTLDLDGFSLWGSEAFTESLAARAIGVLFLGGSWLEEEIFIAALEGARQGFDVRVLADLCIARHEPDRSLVLDRFALHGVLALTVRQALLEWGASVDDPIVKAKVRELLA